MKRRLVLRLLPLILIGLGLGGSAFGQARHRGGGGRGGGGAGSGGAGSGGGERGEPGALASASGKAESGTGPAIVHAQKGTFVSQVQLVGDVQATKQRYLAPAFSTKLAMLAEDGSLVKKGDIVARLDSKTIEEDLDEQQLELDVAKSNLTEQDNTTAADTVRLDAEIQRALSELDQKQLALRQLEQGTRPEELKKRQLQRDLTAKALELARSTLALKEKLAAKGISTKLEVLEASLALATAERDARIAAAELQQARIGATPLTRQLARLELAKARQQLAWARENRSLTLQQASLSRQKLAAKLSNVSSRVAQLRAQMSQSVMHAPLAGTVVLSKTWTNEGLKRPAVGDDVEEGNPFLSVADLSVVRIRSELDETLLREVKIGMKCTIQLPSLPGRRFSGKVTRIGVLAHERSGRQNTQGLSKVFDLELVPDRQDAVFQPGTSVDIQLPLQQKANVLLLPRTALWRDGKRHYVLLADGSERDVTLGEANEKDVVIVSGLSPADKVRLSASLAGEAKPEAGP
ncbi:MAG: efflux RND transporter periplasmic adaptor subunit [Candidatus Sericytochromatia bacterium]